MNEIKLWQAVLEQTEHDIRSKNLKEKVDARKFLFEDTPKNHGFPKCDEDDFAYICSIVGMNWKKLRKRYRTEKPELLNG